MSSFLKRTFLLLSLILISLISKAVVPQPAHVVVVVFENHSYSQIIGSSAAPYINSLLTDSKCALFTESYGLTHPSQPNYIQLFSGSTQGVTNNNLPAGIPFTTPNLGAELLAASKTFIGYSESLPSVGYTGEVSGAYARKHNPWVNWQGAATNAVPASLNQPFTAFPTDFNLLPTVSFVVPNQDNDMHNGTNPTSITIGDTWFQNNLGAYIQWAKTNNSLLVFTFDEDDNVSNQHIATFFIGQMVQGGNYSTHIDHYNILRMIEDMYGLSHAGAAATSATIDYCWTTCSQTYSINANSPLTFCQGGSVTLSASGGTSWLWSNGATTSSITVSSSGNYSVAVTDNFGCTSSLPAVTVTANPFKYDGAVFAESMGTVSVNTAIATHDTNNGFDNDGFTMTGTADVRASSPSSGYAGATAAGNIFFTNASGRNFIISGINTTGLDGLQLSFGIFKSTTTGTGSDFQVKVSSDGTNYTTLSYSTLPAGSGTATWYLRTATGTIPSVPNLRIQFIQNGTATQYRIDDISLTYSMSSPVISAAGPTSFCSGGNVQLNSTIASAYNWSNGSTLSSTTVSSAGNYFVVATGNNGCTASSNIISVSILPGPSITSLNPSYGIAGSNITLNGNNFNGITSLSFNGANASYTYINPTQVNAVVPAGATTGPITMTTTCGSGSSSTFTVVPPTITLNLKLFIEGYYLGGGQMKNILGGSNCDSINVELHQSISPYNTFITSKSIVSTSGLSTINISGSAYGNSYYISVSARNAVKCWSASPVLFSQNTNYFFNTSASQVFGNFCKDLGDGNFALFSGDITQDDKIDVSDITSLKNAAKNFTTGYSRSDLNGDNIVETVDFSLLENNSIPLVTPHP